MSKFKFINQKDQIISLYNDGVGYTEIAKILFPDLNVKSAEQNVRRLIIHYLGPQKKKLTPIYQHKEDVRKLLESGKRPIEIATILRMKLPTVDGFIHKNFPEYKFTINHGNIYYFDCIDSASKAYIVGFIAADGCIVKTRTCTTLTITIKDSDADVLKFIKEEIGCDNTIKDIIRPSSYDKNKIIYHKRLCISDRTLCSALERLGITCRKSLSMSNIIQNIPYEFRDAFIIGYFDGDGSVCVNNKLTKKINKPRAYPDHSLRVSFRGTKDFLFGVCDHLDISHSHVHQYCTIATLSFASKKDVMRFFNCYKNLQFYYKRKYDKFLLRINHPSYDKYR